MFATKIRMSNTKSKYINPQAECCLCGKVGSIEYHHIIPKSTKVVTDTKPKFVCEIEKNRIKYDSGMPKTFRIEKMQIRVCPECHILLHMEFKKYRLIK